MSFLQILFLSVALLLALLHFQSGDALTRSLIRFDDHSFIEPLQNLSLKSYFTEWLGQPNHYAFPLRDLTFALDFKLSELLSLKTFWLSNFTFFIGFLALWLLVLKGLTQSAVSSEARATSGENPLWPVWLLGAFHPVNGEIVQWASNRKHLLVGFLTTVGTAYVLRLWQRRKPLQEEGAFILLLPMIATWLCWPTGIL